MSKIRRQDPAHNPTATPLKDTPTGEPGRGHPPAAPAPPGPLSSGFYAGRTLPTQAGSAGAGVRHQLDARLRATSRDAVIRGAITALLPNASSRTTWSKALDRLAGMAPEARAAAQERLRAAGAAASDPAQAKGALLEPAVTRAAKYADPDEIATKDPLQALGRLLTRHKDDDRFLGAVSAAVPLLEGLAEAGLSPDAIVEQGAQLSRAFSSAYFGQPTLRDAARPLRERLDTLVDDAWEHTAEAIRDEVAAAAQPATSVDDIDAPRQALAARLDDLTLGGRRFSNARGARGLGDTLARSLDSTQRAVALAHTDYVEGADASALKALGDRLAEAYWVDTPEMNTARARVADAHLSALTPATAEDPRLYDLHAYVSRLATLKPRLPEARQGEVDRRLRAAAQTALKGPRPSAPDNIDASIRFRHLGDVAAQLKGDDPLQARLLDLRAELAGDLLDDRLRSVYQAYGSDGRSFDSHRERCDELLTALERTLPADAHAALKQKVDGAFSEYRQRIERHEKYEAGMSRASRSWSSPSRPRRSGMSMEMKVALITAAM